VAYPSQAPVQAGADVSNAVLNLFFLFPIFGIPNLPLPEDLPLNPGRGARQLGAICAGPWLSCSFRVALKFFGETSPRILDPRARDMIDGIPRVPFACGA
jgi:hypothetical protein